MVFADESIQALLRKNVMTDMDTVEAGIGFEKDRVLLYSEVWGTMGPVSNLIKGELL
jgi:hypothetical protein